MIRSLRHRAARLIPRISAAYESRMKKKFKKDIDRMKQIQSLAFGQSPLGILRELKKMDDNEK